MDDHLTKTVASLILMFGFLILAFGSLFIAMLTKSRACRYTLLGIGFVLLVAQQGCCAALNSFNRAFGGGSDEMWITYLSLILSALFVLFACGFVYQMHKQKRDKRNN